MSTTDLHLDLDDLSRRIRERCELTGTFKLRSGIVADHYFDKFLFNADPVLLREITEAMAPLIPAGVDALAGLELGGIPIVTVLSQVTGIPARFVRKQAKTYGTERLAEGGDVDGVRLCVVEDVVTTGGQVVESCNELRARGAEVVCVLCVIDRSGGTSKVAEAGFELRSLFQFD